MKQFIVLICLAMCGATYALDVDEVMTQVKSFASTVGRTFDDENGLEGIIGILVFAVVIIFILGLLPVLFAPLLAIFLPLLGGQQTNAITPTAGVFSLNGLGRRKRAINAFTSSLEKAHAQYK